MAETEHTPGPWKILAEGCDKPYIRIRGSRLGGRFKIANVLTPVYEGMLSKEAEETRANAHLIAAAPDLLEALKGYISLRDKKLAIKYSDETTTEAEKAQIRKAVSDNIIALLVHDDKARAAIAKATQLEKP